jgi:hypothetical protein
MIAAPGNQPNVSGPTVSVTLDISAAYLRENALDPSGVIGDVQIVCAAIVNGASTTATLDASTFETAVVAVGGVLAVLEVAIDGGAAYSGDGNGGVSYLVLPSGVLVSVRTIQ